MMLLALAFALLATLAAMPFVAAWGLPGGLALPLLAALSLGLYGIWGDWHGTAIQQLSGQRASAAHPQHRATLERRLLARLQSRVRRLPGNVDYHFLLGTEQMRQGRHDQAAQSFAAAARLQPDNPLFASKRLEAIILANDYRLDPGLVRAAEDLIRRHPRQLSLMFLMGVAEFRTGNRAAAIAWWQRALPHASGATRQLIQSSLERAQTPPTP